MTGQDDANWDDEAAFPIIPDAASWEDAQAILSERGLSDGLPLVPPTARRMAAMLEGVADPSQSYGFMAPMFGDLTAEAIAYNCVLAGCDPAALPVVLTAAEACLEADFNLLGLLTTTGAPAIATLVHGPIARALGMNSQTNCLGPGNAANATLGRAMSLIMRNIGGAREMTGDMATMGQPGKYSFCFAENDQALIPSLAERRGFNADDNAVTVMGVSGTVEVLPLDDRDSAEAILRPIAAAMMATGAVAGAGRARTPGEHVFLLPPEMAEGIAKHGWDLARIQNFLFETETVAVPGVAEFSRAAPAASAPEDIHPIITGGAGLKMTYMPIWAGGSRTQTRRIRNLRG